MHCFKFFFIIFIFFYQTITSSVPCKNHVSFFLKNSVKNKAEINYYNNKIHEATFAIKQYCKKNYKNAIETNINYHHRKDTVFFISYDHDCAYWTLYKPSFIPYKKFIKIAKKIYKNYGVQVDCYQDRLVKIHHDVDLENNYVTVNQLEEYKHTLKVDTIAKYLFWYLQIPTTGLMKHEQFDIDEAYKPLAWHFLLWDLAPKKGKGAHVAIIDTGISAFNILEEAYTDIYKKNINITASENIFTYNYNLTSNQGLNPISQTIINFGHYCDHQKFDSRILESKISEWIIDLIENGKNDTFRNYFIKNAKKEYLDQDNKDINQKGEAVLKDLLYGKYGIIPYEKNSFFTIAHLEYPYNKKVILETLPAPKIVGNKDPFAAGHGTFTQGIVNGKLYNDLGIHGLAPDACVTMIKAFDDDGTTNKSTLYQALRLAKADNNSIVSMSLKITDDINMTTDMPLKKVIDSIDYVVAACGNDGKNEKLKNKEAYPAKFDSVAFDVGAFGYDDGNYPICAFTQKEASIGPKFVAPGCNLLSAGLVPNQKDDSMYVFMSGTSIAVPVITGFLALVLGEFKDVFTREQILKVIYKFSIKLNKDEFWQKYIKIGTPDMRSCLLCLHVLQALQKSLKNRSDFAYLFDQYFDNLVQAIYLINYSNPLKYEKTYKISFTQDFSGYCKSINNKDSISFEHILFKPKNLSECIDYIHDIIFSTLKKICKQGSNNKIKKHQDIFEPIESILKTKNFNLFADKNLSTQKRIHLALQKRV